MKTTKRRNQSRLFLSFLALGYLLCGFVQAFAQRVVRFDPEAKTYYLIGNDRIRGFDSVSAHQLVNLALQKHDTLAISTLISRDSRNIKTMILLSLEANTRLPEGDFSPEDQITFKDWLDEAIAAQKFQNWAARSYFQVIYERNFDGALMMLNGYLDMNSSWLPPFCNMHQEFLLLTRHLMKTYYPQELEAFKSFGNDLVGFSAIRFSDLSFTEVIPRKHWSSYMRAIDPQKAEPVNIPNTEIRIAASSQLSMKYTSNNMLDYDLKTVWAEGVKGDGVGETVELKLASKQYVENLLIFPGHSKSESLFHANNRIRKLEISFNGSTREVDIEDCFAPTKISVGAETDNITLKIIAVYTGTHYEDLCIGEIMLTRREGGEPSW